MGGAFAEILVELRFARVSPAKFRTWWIHTARCTVILRHCIAAIADHRQD
jgi:hypothetical protein